jgi:hypothetical protein
MPSSGVLGHGVPEAVDWANCIALDAPQRVIDHVQWERRQHLQLLNPHDSQPNPSQHQRSPISAWGLLPVQGLATLRYQIFQGFGWGLHTRSGLAKGWQ